MDQFSLHEAFDQEGFSFFKVAKKKHTVIGALPSETVTATFVGRKTKESFYIVDEVLSPHKDRITPRCQHVPRCGGCVMQNLDYKAQLYYKSEKIKNLFLDFQDKILPILSSPVIYQYRGKMDFSFSQNKAGEKFLGLTQAKGAGRVINTVNCSLCEDWVNEALNILQESFKSSELQAYDRKGHGDLRSVILRQGMFTQEKMIVLEVIAHPNSEINKKALIEFLKPLKEHFKEENISYYLRIVQMIPKVPTQIYEMHLGGPLHISEVLKIDERDLKFKISPSAFFQPNPRCAAILFNKICEIVKPLGGGVLIDLFCGTGTIGLCLARYFDEVIGIEINPYAVFDAKENSEINGIKNISFVAEDAASFVKTTTVKPNVVTVDPPRAGLGIKACSYILNLSPSYILYISCNPVTQQIDTQQILDGGYQVMLIQPLDQFPHTNHIENIILFKKKTEAC
jgi:23S rRNA (uracil-5-)-methyltransferase RumA